MHTFYRRHRTLRLEVLESRLTLDGDLLPLHADPREFTAWMMGSVRVNVVAFESNGSIDPNLTNWTSAERSRAKQSVGDALAWWVEMLRRRNSVHELQFDVDYTFLDNPVPTGYDPKYRPYTIYAELQKEFAKAVGAEAIRLQGFNHQQRVEHGTHWAFTIFITHPFSDGGTAYTGVDSASSSVDMLGWASSQEPRFASVLAHEIGHLFGAADEYVTSEVAYYSRWGVYNTQNLNARGGNPDPGSRVVSIMDNDLPAYQQYAISPSGAAMIGWQDTDADGIFDVLDQPLSLNGTGAYGVDGKYRFTGSSAVTVYDEQNPNTLYTNDLTINTVDVLEYRIDNGNWIIVNNYHSYDTVVSMEVGPFSEGTHQIEIRTRDLDSPPGLANGIASQIFSDSFTVTEPLTAPILSVIETRPTSVTLSWTDSNKEIGYHVFQNGVRLKSVPADSTSTTVADLLENTRYTFRIQAYTNGFAESADSNVVVTNTNNETVIELRESKDLTGLTVQGSSNPTMFRFEMTGWGMADHSLAFSPDAGKLLQLELRDANGKLLSKGLTARWTLSLAGYGPGIYTAVVAGTGADVINYSLQFRGQFAAGEPDLAGLDIDGDGSVNAVTENRLLNLYLAKFPASVIEQFRAPGATRNGMQIKQFLDSLGDALDFDGDGKINAVTESRLLNLYLAKFPASILDAFRGPNPVRTGTEIKARLDGLLKRATSTIASEGESVLSPIGMAPAMIDYLIAALPLHNAALATDVNFDGFTTPADVLMIVNHLNDPAAGFASPTFLDVDGNKLATPLDALHVINVLNGAITNLIQAEGESANGARGDFVAETSDVAGDTPDSRDAVALAFDDLYGADARQPRLPTRSRAPERKPSKNSPSLPGNNLFRGGAESRMRETRVPGVSGAVRDSLSTGRLFETVDQIFAQL